MVKVCIIIFEYRRFLKRLKQIHGGTYIGFPLFDLRTCNKESLWSRAVLAPIEIDRDVMMMTQHSTYKVEVLCRLRATNRVSASFIRPALVGNAKILILIPNALQKDLRLCTFSTLN